MIMRAKKDNTYLLEFWKALGAIHAYDTKNHHVYLHHNKCQHITDDNKCGIYDDRPELCRDFPNKDLPPLWRSFCALFHERNGDAKQLMRVFKTE